MKHKIPNNTVRVIANIDGDYQVKDYDLKQMVNDPEACINLNIPNDMVTENTNMIDKSCLKVNEPVLIDPFIPYAMTLEPGKRFLERTELSIADICDQRMVIETSYVDDKPRMLQYPAIVGDAYGPTGIFVPMNATPQALNYCIDLFSNMAERYEEGAYTALMEAKSRNKKDMLPF